MQIKFTRERDNGTSALTGMKEGWKRLKGRDLGFQTNREKGKVEKALKIVKRLEG